MTTTTQPETRNETNHAALPEVRLRITNGAILTATVLSGLFAGFFGTYTFSVTRGLAQVDDVTYVESFQAINNTIRNPWFAVVFFGAAPATLLALVLARTTHRRSMTLLAAGLGLLIVTMGITFVGNVPLNDSLGLVDAGNQQAASEARRNFEDGWNMLNAARTVASLGGFTCIATAHYFRTNPTHTNKTTSTKPNWVRQTRRFDTPSN